MKERRNVQRGTLEKPGFLHVHPPNVAERTHISCRLWTGRCGGDIQGRAAIREWHRALPEHLPTPRKLDLAHPVGQEPVVSDTLETTREDMQEKAPEKFDRVQGHDALAIAALSQILLRRS